MKLTVKTLQGAKFMVEADPSFTILHVKELCAKEKDSDASLIKLIHSGKVLANESTVEASGLDEKVRT